MPQLSRRAFAQLLGTAAAASTIPLQLVAKPGLAARTVRLSANENPYGPSPAAMQAMREAFSVVSRYPNAAVDELVAAIAKHHGVTERQIILGDGSSEILKLAALAFLSSSRPLVVADPTFEALAIAAAASGADVRRVPLDSDYGHDTEKMRDAARGAGLVYICNPNNPTATITPDKSVRAFIGAAGDTPVLVDEAYHHYATSRDYSSVVDLVARQPNLLVSRTFSKIYGIAGLRCGYCVGQEEIIRKLATHQAWDSVNIMALVAARASLGDQAHVADHRRRNTETKAWLRQSVERLGFRMLPSEANFVMIDVKRDVTPLITSMRGEGVAIGRLFPAMPHHMRVTIGTPEEMRRFVEALGKTATA